MTIENLVVDNNHVCLDKRFGCLVASKHVALRQRDLSDINVKRVTSFSSGHDRVGCNGGQLCAKLDTKSCASCLDRRLKLMAEGGVISAWKLLVTTNIAAARVCCLYRYQLYLPSRRIYIYATCHQTL